MEVPAREMLARMPLAEAVLLLLRFVTTPEAMESLWQRHRGRCYQKLISFGTMVQLISAALLNCGGSGRQAFRRHIDDDALDTSIQAVYGKLRRLPLAVSEAFLRESTARLRCLFPAWAEFELPASLRHFDVIKLDGKALKRVAKRLKATRGVSGGLLGGRALVALHWSTGLVIALRSHEDGEANDVKFVGDLVPEVRQLQPGPVLWVGDRAFCDLTQPQHFTSRPGDHFLVRHHPKTKFHRDPTIEQRRGKNDEGQTYVETWGFLGSATNKHRRFVRQIEIKRPQQETVTLITDLLDAKTYPAEDLMWMYRQRWDIEQVFQKVTEVFHLQQLIGSTPKASVFQFSLCLLLYNLTQVVRGYLAEAENLEPEDISTELLFRDIQTQLKCWELMIDREQTLAYFSGPPHVEPVRKRLGELLGNCWTEMWRKTTSGQRKYKPPGKRHKSHGSVYRIEQALKNQRHPNRKRNTTSSKPGNKDV